MGAHTAATKSTSLTPTASHVAGALWLLLVPTAKIWELHVPSSEPGGVLVQNRLGSFKIHLILCPNTTSVCSELTEPGTLYPRHLAVPELWLHEVLWVRTSPASFGCTPHQRDVNELIYAWGCFASLDQKLRAQVSVSPSQEALTDAQFAQGIQNEDGKTVPQLAASASLPSLPAGGSIWKLLPLSALRPAWGCSVFLTRTIMTRWQNLPAMPYSL